MRGTIIKTVTLTLVMGFFIFITIGFLGATLIKGCSEITDRGLKNIVEEVWEGRQSQGETK